MQPGGNAAPGKLGHPRARARVFLVVRELVEPAAPREVHLVAGHPITANDKIDKRRSGPGTWIADRSCAPGVWHAPG